MTLQQQHLSLDFQGFSDLLASSQNLLIVQDLDGVCMPLVKNPLDRAIDPAYLTAVTEFDGHFFVLTNGEHVGKRGLQTIIEKALGNPQLARDEGLYLPGLAAGGVQWQDRYGDVSHPGVSQTELDFLAAVPAQITQAIDRFLQTHCQHLSPAARDRYLSASVLDNKASPTANLNSLYELFSAETPLPLSDFVTLQRQMVALMERLLADASSKGLNDRFFVHYAPNLGSDGFVHEAVWFANAQTAGTTDFQFMLRGAVKEAGVLALLNHYWLGKTGHYPLGVDFNARQAPRSLPDMLQLVKQNFDPALMPVLVGVGDTVTSQGVETDAGLEFKRGGSDRNFLQLIQNIGEALEVPTVTAYVDSSGGELSNRRPLQIEPGEGGRPQVISGIGDPRDRDDPLRINIVFPGGPEQYCATFQAAASQRAQMFQTQ